MAKIKGKRNLGREPDSWERRVCGVDDDNTMAEPVYLGDDVYFVFVAVGGWGTDFARALSLKRVLDLIGMWVKIGGLP